MDSFFGIGIAELFFIAIIALVVLGPERLPGAIREVMKVVRTLRNLTTELTSQFSDEIKTFDDLNPQKLLREMIDDPDGKKAQADKAKVAAKPGATAKSTPAKSATAKPSTSKPTTTKPATPSTTAKPATTKPATAKPATVTAKPAAIVSAPAADAPAEANMVETDTGETSAIEGSTVDGVAVPEASTLGKSDAEIADGSAPDHSGIVEKTTETATETATASVGVFDANTSAVSSAEDSASDEPGDKRSADGDAPTQPSMTSATVDAETDADDEPSILPPHLAHKVDAEPAPSPVPSQVDVPEVELPPVASTPEPTAETVGDVPRRSPAHVNGAHVNGTSKVEGEA